MTMPMAHTQRTDEQKQRRNILLVFAGLVMTMLLASLDQTIFSTALPTIVGELNGVNAMLWVITIYILASTITLPIYGKMGDLVGRKGIFMGAISLFIIGSVVGGFAQDMTWLIAGRGIQGLGGGGLMVLSQAIIADVVPARERGKYMGIMGGVFALSSVAGPLLGGWFTEEVTWRWCLWMNIPLGIAALAAAFFFLHLPEQAKGQRVRVDVAGMLLLAIASTALVLTTTWGGTTYAWGSGIIMLLISLTVAAGALFIWVESRAEAPIMSMKLFKEPNFIKTTVAGLVIGVAMFGTLAYLPTFLQMVTGANATQAGLLMIPMMGGLLLTSIGSGAFVSKTGRYKWFPVVGTLIVSGALALLSTMNAELQVWIICSYLALMGIGLGLGMQILVLIVQNTFPNSQVGMATAANNYFRQIGASIGTAVVGSLFVTNLGNLLSERMSAAGAAQGGDANSFTPDLVRALPDDVRSIIVGAYSDALTPVFLYMVPLVFAAAIVLVFLREKPLATTIERDGGAIKEPEPEDLDTDPDTPAFSGSALAGDRGEYLVGESASSGAKATDGGPRHRADLPPR